jgi:hypothetical protein
VAVPSDFVPVPQRAITEMAEELINILPPDARFFDGAAGTGAIGQTLRKVMPRSRLLGIEKNEELHHELWAWNKTTAPNLVYQFTQHSDIEDFKTKDAAGKFDCFIARPPDNSVTEFLDHLLKLASFNDDCPVILLFRIERLFDQSPDWVTWWNAQPLTGIRILTGHVLEGYAWFMFNTPGVKQMGWYKCQR